MQAPNWYQLVNILENLEDQQQVYVNVGVELGSYRIVRYSEDRYSVQYMPRNLEVRKECKLKRGSLNAIFDYLHREWQTVH